MDQPTDHQYYFARQFGDHDENKDPNKTPRDASDAWRFTPSILDTNSFAFASFANQPPAYYTPNAGGTGTAYHNQAGDLHTPGMGFNLGTPLSMPTSDSNIHSTTDIQGFNPQMFEAHHYHASNIYPSQQSYAPSSFIHQEPGFDAMEASTGDSPAHDIKMEADMRRESNLAAFTPRTFESMAAPPPLPPLEK